MTNISSQWDTSLNLGSVSYLLCNLGQVTSSFKFQFLHLPRGEVVPNSQDFVTADKIMYVKYLAEHCHVVCIQ